MIKPLIILSLLSLIFLSSCGERESDELFQETYSLEGFIPAIDKIYLLGLVHIHDSLLIVTTTPKSYKQIHLFNKENFEYLASAGGKGRGPGEISNPFSTVIDKGNSLIWFMDQGKKRFWKFDLSEILNNPKYLPSDFIPINTRQVIINFTHFEDSLFYYVNDDPSIFASFFNTQGSQIDSIQIDNSINLYTAEDLSYDTRRTLLYYFVDHNIQNNLFTIVYRYSNLVCIVDERGNLKYSNKDINRINEIPNLNNINKNPFVTHVRSNEKYIYLLHNSSDIGSEGFCEEMKMDELHIYNWDAEPLIELKLDHTVFSFDIDYDNNRIVTFSKDQGGIICYTLPDEIKKYFQSEM